MAYSSEDAISILQIEADQWRVWRCLRLQALAEAPYAFSSKLSDWQGAGDTEMRWRARLLSVPVNYIAHLDRTAAGMVSATAPNQEGIVELISLWVAPAVRGRHVGDALVRAVVAWARAQRSWRVALDVVETNERAVALYRRHGFVDSAAIVGDCSACERRMTLNL